MYIPHFAYPFICWWILGLFPSFSYVNNTVNMGVQIPPFPAFTSFGYIVIPWYQQGIGSKTCHRYQNPRMFNSHSWPFVSTVPHLWIQPTANLVVLYIFIKKRKKSVYKWTRAVQTHVVQGSTVYLKVELLDHIVIMFNFLRNCCTIFILHSHQWCTGYQFLHILTNTCYFLFSW